MSDAGLWGRLERRFALVSLRPRLAEDVRVRTIGADQELLQAGTRRVLPISSEDAETIRRFDGTQTVAEIIVSGIGEGAMTVEPVLSLIDRLVRAEMLDRYPPHLYRELERHFRARAAEHGELLDSDREPDPDPAPGAQTAEPSQSTAPEPRRSAEGPWRARSPTIAERARFLRGVKLFAALDMHSIGALADGAHAETWPPASVIVSEGGRADRFFVVHSGEVLVQRRERDGGDPKGIARLGPGEWFGESALIDAAPRNASVRAGDTREARLLSFDVELFDRYIRPHVTVDAGPGGLVSSRRQQLEQVPVFRALAPDDLDRLARVLREHTAERGEVIFRQGDEAVSFYVIVEGAVGVVKDGAPIAKLVAGEFFGETALLFADDRTATIAATEPTRLWVLDRDAFETFLRDALLHRRELMPTVLNRLGSNRPV